MTEQHSAHERCDILIIGAGPAGLAAAVAAAPSGASITIVDDNPQPGGQIWRAGPQVALPALAQQHRAALARHTNIRLLPGTRVMGLGGTQPIQPGGKAPALLLEDADRGWTQHSHRIVLCTGARELLLPFPGWTLPGVTGAGALQALIKAGLDVRGQRIVIAGTGPLLLAAAATANKAGATVVRVAEQAPWSALAGFAAQLPRWPAKALQALTLLHSQLRASSHVLEVQGTKQVQTVRLRKGQHAEETMACDRVACGFGLVPNTHLGQMLGCALGGPLSGGQGLAVDAQMRTSVPGVFAAGEATGFGGSERALVQGAIAGHVAAGQVQQAQALRPQLARWEGFAQALQASFPLNEALKTLAQPGTLVCRCEDVPYAALADRDGWIDAKLHTRCGMGACQGRICGAATQHLFGWTPAPPRHLLAPARIGTLAACTPAPTSEPVTPSG
ncbi:pyridine nucleotide-disulfide oxidoreductase [Acidovorax sp. Root267]|uniref:NAD(P)/FAD-dependent oxidoreductase n=1 Tax=Acidovorax sp. Root267 TaxID=1736505 RepID=UPI000709E932|nr:FAD/NAD(P)-binding oxidoreductase [Acidovorax sp. Root267]KRD18502.1 pyridine nucleotide-disulfide oxidoreductase [Acidovorax sp. Root267]